MPRQRRLGVEGRFAGWQRLRRRGPLRGEPASLRSPEGVAFGAEGGVSAALRSPSSSRGEQRFFIKRSNRPKYNEMRFASKGLVYVLGALFVAGCSAGSPASPETPLSPTPPSPPLEYAWPLSATVVLTAQGPEPSSVTINVGGRVTFINNDARPHEMVSDPDLLHDDCPTINRVGFLAPGQSGVTGVFESARTCGFHDHLDPLRYIGRIEVRID